MNAVFADTSFYVAAVNPHDVLHGAAKRLSRGFNGKVITTDYVLIEVGNWLARSADRALFVDLVKVLRSDPQTMIVPSDRGVFDAGLNLYVRRQDKDWSFTDCISFVVMQEWGLRESLTADHHFEQAGFVALLK